MDANTTVKQAGNIVGGDQAAGDINKHHHVHLPPSSQRTKMSLLIEKYRTETENDKQIKVLIDRLQRWEERAVGDMMGLEEKLKKGNRPDIILTAIAAKDCFSKLLVKHEYSAAAKEIFAYLLAKVHLLFQNIVYPAIQRGVPPADIDLLLITEVHDKVEIILEDNPLGIAPEEIMGMLYFLTGNCHLKWSVDANLQPGI